MMSKIVLTFAPAFETKVSMLKADGVLKMVFRFNFRCKITLEKITKNFCPKVFLIQKLAVSLQSVSLKNNRSKC